MKARLFSIYLRYRKSLLIAYSAIAFIIVSTNSWLEYKYKSASYNPWKVDKIESGDRFTVVRDDETKTIELCGISASGDEAKDYLRSIANVLGRDSYLGTEWERVKPGTYRALS